MKIRKKDIQFFLVGCGLLFIPSLLRVGMLKSQWALVNVLSWIGIILLTQRYYGGGRVVLSKDGSNGVANPLLIITLIILFLIEGMMLPYFSAESKIKYIYATILPCYILYVSLPGQEIIRYFKMFAKLLTIASTIVVVCGIFDIFIGTSIGKTIAEFSAADSLIESIRQGTPPSLGCKMVLANAENYEALYFLTDEEVLDAAACYRRWWEERQYPKTRWTIDPCYDEPLCGTGYRWW